MKVNKIFESLAKTKPMQKAYQWCCKPKSEYFLNNTLPTIETALSTTCYVWSTAKQDIDKDQKDLLQIQNIGSGLVGIAIGSWANRKVGKFGEEIIKGLDTTKIDPKSIRKMTTGIRIAAPIFTTALVMRLALPTLLAGFSGKWMDKVREKRAQKKLNIDA